MNNKVAVSDLLGIAFIVLKLCGVIDWHWAWVTAPIWGGILFSSVVSVLVKRKKVSGNADGA